MRLASVISFLLLFAIGVAGSLRAQEANPKTNVKTDAAGVKSPSPKEPVKEPVKEGAKKPVSSADKIPGGRPNRPGDQLVITPEREAAAMTFVKQHHPELAELVVVLKESRPKEYQKAIRDLYRSSERLADLQQADLQRYELELKGWRNQSRLQLLAARVQMSPSDEKLKTELKEELARQFDVRFELLQLERQRLADRLGKIDMQIEKMKQSRESQIERQFQELLGKQPVKGGKPMKKPAAKP